MLMTYIYWGVGIIALIAACFVIYHKLMWQFWWSQWDRED